MIDLERYLFPSGFRSPDAHVYLAAGRGDRVAAPFSRRWLAPRLFGDDLAVWRFVTIGSIVLVALQLAGTSGFAAVAFLGLPMVRTWARIGVTPDALAFGLAMCAATPGAPVELRIVAALLAGATRETAPIFAALWSWSLLPLVGLLAVPWWRGGRGATRLHRPAWGIGPWGLLSVITPLDVRTLATVAAAYAQCLIASDGARLYQWAAPVVLAGLSSEPTWAQAAIAASVWLAKWEL